MNYKLGELIFNGTVLFLSISFGLFPSSAGKIGVSNPVWFTVLIFLAVVAGLLSLGLSFFGIKKKMNLKCLFGFHIFEKFMGLSNVGGGKFRQKYKCKICWKIKEIVG